MHKKCTKKILLLDFIKITSDGLLNRLSLDFSSYGFIFMYLVNIDNQKFLRFTYENEELGYEKFPFQSLVELIEKRNKEEKYEE